MLELTPGLETLGTLRYELLGLLALAWVIVYFCLWRSVRATGRVVYVTATVPYALLAVFLANGLMLPGARQGLEFFLTPQWGKMMEAKVQCVRRLVILHFDKCGKEIQCAKMYLQMLTANKL